MNINRELLNFYVCKKIIKRKQIPQIIEDSVRLNTSVQDYLLKKEITTEVGALPALADFYCMP